ncbi:hypothetical protein ERO13_D06G097400v2 [Gossypium hirsutum]|uniref:Reticulon-like protein n=1 Tax=Gossypium hirsutum TaxID=3635 RepID=A0ABM3A8Y5_GOSHI|nr:reticulon-like protein B21 isoform X2 [Gossypium hirsutum]KAG4141816.1 hypothetical protein ERO13_D06G097400v2 [Gossypium hirsutum]
MDSSNSRRTGGKSSVVAGSVRETRMKSNEFKGGIKVFNEEENGNGEGNNAGGDKRLSLKKGQTFGVVGVSGKRKTWKSESFEGLEKNPIRVAKGRSMEHCKDLSLSVDGIKKVSPTQVKKGIRDLSKSVDGIERTPIHSKKLRSDVAKKGVEMSSKDGIESGEGLEGNSVKASAQSCDENGNDDKVLVFDDEKIEGSDKDSNENLKDESDCEEHCKECGVCQEMVISSNGDDEEDEEMEEVGDEKTSFDIKEMNVPEVEKKPNKIANEIKPNKAVNEVKKLQEDNKPSKVTNGVKKTSQFPIKAAPFSPTLNKQPPPVVKHATLYDDYHYQSFPQTQNQLHNLVDLVMWRDVSKSALIFGVGTFIIISSSYTQDLDISCITVTSYVGLVYLAAIFLYRSIICRGVVDVDESRCVVGEEEAIWVLKLVLPYLNEFLLKLRALFSGDPYTTMKLAVLLFVLARCGSSITVWKMAKLGFFGVFTVPKVCSSYSHQLTAYAFMLFVAWRYYQQKMVGEEDWVEAETGPTNGEYQAPPNPMGRKLRHGVVGPSKMLPNKLKKRS